MNALKKLILVLVVLQMVFAPAIASADMEDSIKLQKNMKTIQQSGVTFKKVSQAVRDIRKDTVKADKDNVTTVGTEATLKPPARPGDTETDPKVWEKYYKEYLDYIKKLDTGKQQAAWEKMAQDFLALSKDHPERISANAMNTVMDALTAELKKCYEDPNYKLDFSKTAASIVNATLNVIKSDAFWKFSEATQIAVANHFTRLAVELSWRSANNSKYQTLYNTIGEIYGKLMNKGSINVKAGAFNNLMHLFRISGWGSTEGNREVANQILKKAIETAGGLKSLIDSFMSGLNNSSLTDAQRGSIATALANVMCHRAQLETQTGYIIGDTRFGEIVAAVNTFIDNTNNGKIKPGDGIKGNLLHLVGSYINRTISAGKPDEKLIASFKTLAKNALESTNIALQAIAINKLNQLAATSTAKNKKELAEGFIKVITDSKLDVAAFLKEANKKLQDNAGNKDRLAYLGAAMANLARIHLEQKTGKINADNVKMIFGCLKSWTTPENLNKMRCMSWQTLLFTSLAKLSAQVFTKGSDIIAKNPDIARNLVAFCKNIPGLKDSLVKKLAVNAVKELISHLNKQGFMALGEELLPIIS